MLFQSTHAAQSLFLGIHVRLILCPMHTVGNAHPCQLILRMTDSHIPGPSLEHACSWSFNMETGQQSKSCPTGDLAKSPSSQRLLKRKALCMHEYDMPVGSGSVHTMCVRRQPQVSSSSTLLEMGSLVLCSLHTRLAGLSGGSVSAIGAGITDAPRFTMVLCAPSAPSNPSSKRPSPLVLFLLCKESRQFNPSMPSTTSDLRGCSPAIAFPTGRLGRG